MTPSKHGIFIVSGRGIKPGVTLDTVDAVDIAPTAARLLGVDLKDLEGRVLKEVLVSRMP